MSCKIIKLQLSYVFKNISVQERCQGEEEVSVHGVPAADGV
jgi:hypothetical protein